MQRLICSTSFYSVGCTFLDWSINYLSGQTHHYNYYRGLAPLSCDPLTKKDSHGHDRNHPKGLAQTKEYVEQLRKHTDFVSIYLVPLIPFMAMQELGIDSASQNQDLIFQHRNQDYTQTMSWLHDQGFDIIFVDIDPSLPLYTFQPRSTEWRPFSGGIAGSIEVFRDDVDQAFFPHSVKTWNDMGLTNIWDKRERMALDYRPFDRPRHDFDFPPRHRWIDCRELWWDRDCIPETMAWLDLPINPTRLDSWQPIFQKWQAIQHRAVRFQYQCQHIVEATIKGWDYPIDLTFEQEVIVLHCLLYHHDLNLKSWNLVKFPDNTRELHRLLEPNIHQLNRSV